jgi:hypothetical protein
MLRFQNWAVVGRTLLCTFGDHVDAVLDKFWLLLVHDPQHYSLLAKELQLQKCNALKSPALVEHDAII